MGAMRARKTRVLFRLTEVVRMAHLHFVKTQGARFIEKLVERSARLDIGKSTVLKSNCFHSRALFKGTKVLKGNQPSHNNPGL